MEADRGAGAGEADHRASAEPDASDARSGLCLDRNTGVRSVRSEMA